MPLQLRIPLAPGIDYVRTRRRQHQASPGAWWTLVAFLFLVALVWNWSQFAGAALMVLSALLFIGHLGASVRRYRGLPPRSWPKRG